MYYNILYDHWHIGANHLRHFRESKAVRGALPLRLSHSSYYFDILLLISDTFNININKIK